MHAGFDGQARHVEVEVVRNGAHHGVAVAHGAQHGGVVANVKRCGKQPRARKWRQKLGKVTNVHIGEPHLRDLLILQQVVRARRAL
jgi:hypothetical protein